jgi:hypothetical protein
LWLLPLCFKYNYAFEKEILFEVDQSKVATSEKNRRSEVVRRSTSAHDPE